MHPDLPRAVSDPNFRMVVGGQQTVRTREVVAASVYAGVPRVDEDCDAVVRGINDVNRFMAAISQEVPVEHWIDPTDVKRN